MGIFEKLENLQNKPKKTRVKILIISVAAIMFLIIVLWKTSEKYSPENIAGYNLPNPLEIIWENIKALKFLISN